MGLADRDYMRARVRRTVARERRGGLDIKPRTLVVLVALFVVVALVVNYLT